MTTYVDQDFTAANGSAPANLMMGRNPTAGGGVSVQSNKARFSTGSTGGYSDNSRVSRTVTVDGTTPLSLTDAVVELEFTPGANEKYPEIILRCSQSTGYNGANGYLFQMFHPDVIRIEKTVAYSFNLLTSASWTWTPGTPYFIRAQASGSSLKMWVTTTLPFGSPILETTDSSLTAAGFVVLNVNGGSAAASTTTDFDDLVVMDSLSSPIGPLLLSNGTPLRLSNTHPLELTG